MINKLPKVALLTAGIACLLASVNFPPPVLAAPTPFEQGKAAYDRGDVATAIQHWYQAAKQGDAEAQFALGTLYYAGLGVPQDHTESSYWFHRSAEQGFAYAQYNLGNAYKRGEGVRKNDKMAVYWWEKAAAQGFSGAMLNLATAYQDGAGVEKDVNRARELYRQAGESGDLAVEDTAPARTETQQPPQPGEFAPPTACRDWLGEHDARDYTLQLMSTTDRTDAEQAAREHGLRDYTVCAYRSRNKTRYALLWGNYPTVAAARIGVEKLPAQLRTADPWIRRLNSIIETLE